MLHVDHTPLHWGEESSLLAEFDSQEIEESIPVASITERGEEILLLCDCQTFAQDVSISFCMMDMEYVQVLTSQLDLVDPGIHHQTSRRRSFLP